MMRMTGPNRKLSSLFTPAVSSSCETGCQRLLHTLLHPAWRTHTALHTHTRTRMHTHTRTRTSTRTRTRTHTYTYTYTYTRTHTHTRTLIQEYRAWAASRYMLHLQIHCIFSRSEE